MASPAAPPRMGTGRQLSQSADLAVAVVVACRGCADVRLRCRLSGFGVPAEAMHRGKGSVALPRWSGGGSLGKKQNAVVGRASAAAAAVVFVEAKLQAVYTRSRSGLQVRRARPR